MVADTIILWAELMIERGRHSLLSTESLCCDLEPSSSQELDSVLQAIWFALERRCGKNPSP
jgi:hypothetical protein